MSRELLLALLILAGVVWGESCNSCGMECESACGTRHFKSCCFNYLKKRGGGGGGGGDDDAPKPDVDPSLRLELWMARSGDPNFRKGLLLDAARWAARRERDTRGRLVY